LEMKHAKECHGYCELLDLVLVPNPPSSYRTLLDKMKADWIKETKKGYHSANKEVQFSLLLVHAGRIDLVTCLPSVILQPSLATYVVRVTVGTVRVGYRTVRRGGFEKQSSDQVFLAGLDAGTPDGKALLLLVMSFGC
jgi:hypothetical protein